MENIYDRIHTSLTWKRILAFNVVLFLVLIVPISIRLSQTSTDNRSSAAGSVPNPSVEPPVAYPQGAPNVDRVSMFFGKAGDTVVILGSNFGAYQWGSQVYVGNVLAPADSIVSWTNSVLSVKIPNGARTGKVWVVVNGKQATWDGNLLLYDVSHAVQIGLQKLDVANATVFIKNGGGVVHGMIELGYTGSPLQLSPAPGVTIVSQTPGVDSLGTTLQVVFTFNPALSSTQVPIFGIQHAQVATISILRTELYNNGNTLLSVFADPLSSQITP